MEAAVHGEPRAILRRVGLNRTLHVYAGFDLTAIEWVLILVIAVTVYAVWTGRFARLQTIVIKFGQDVAEANTSNKLNEELPGLARKFGNDFVQALTGPQPSPGSTKKIERMFESPRPNLCLGAIANSGDLPFENYRPWQQEFIRKEIWHQT